jgi:hypothetical protein
MNDGSRPKRYCRGFEIAKDTNPSLEVSSGIKPNNKS